MPQDTPSPRTLAHPTPSRSRHPVVAVGFTVGLLSLMLLSVSAVAGWVSLGVLVSVSAVVGAFHYLFPGSRFFTIALANFIGIYACIFLFFVELHFTLVSQVSLSVGFTLPLLTFLAGAVWQREAIRAVVLEEGPVLRHRLGRAIVWLLPVAGVGVGTFLIPSGMDPDALTLAYLGAMGLIAGVVLVAARAIAILLLHTGLLFEEFFEGIARLVEPALAFFTFYSLLVIVFASVYTVIDRFSVQPQFIINGQARDIQFAEALYFSVITLSTVGYGDMLPFSDLIRILVSVEVVCGVLLLLFGFNAIFAYSSEQRRNRP
ncbi:potassium channel family protein [Rhodospirillum centenum]|uniref:Potassium channel protein, putative n=1 Tax=Rhodospirillum centenum (strain ATCC 51521 / SW) TaxID=414684 RepID=B6IQT8_RHOCS|nr:potassium channel family protein [Rhodospirillum centenum]ACI97824.1 potassium channel protein, putative [Rhodospirillum centenum SW]